jgi:hypothetical protein
MGISVGRLVLVIATVIAVALAVGFLLVSVFKVWQL